ncbi:major capsid protein [Mycobacterium sp. ZZG]
MPNPLVPSISGNTITTSALLKNPSQINAMVATLAADQLVADAFFRPLGSKVSGGAILYDVLLHGANFAKRDVEPRSPGAEYVFTHQDVEREMATPKDHGAKIEILDEEADRYDTAVIGTRIVTLANTLVRQIDRLAIATVEAALTKYSIAGVPGHNWDDLVTVGPADSITPNSERPLADIASAALLIRMDDLGVPPPNTLVLHPGQHMALQVGYGADLTAVLAAAGITKVRTSTQVSVGVGYVVSAGQAGVMGFEHGGLRTETIPDRERRRTIVQTYASPAYAVPRPGAIRKITGLAG